MKGYKHDGGKARMDLLPPEMLFGVSLVLGAGAVKYTIEVENEWHALLLVPSVQSLHVSTPSGGAVHVTRATCAETTPNTLTVSVRIDSNGQTGTPTVYNNWRSVDQLIQKCVHETSAPSGSAPSNATDLLRTSTLLSVPPAAPSAVRSSICILTIVTPQGDFEASFAPDAITASDFWTTTWRGLSARFGISRPQPAKGDRNWEAGMSWGRYFAALMRHMWAWWGGAGPTTKNFLFGDLDEETGYSHLWHAGCCLAFLIAYEERGVGTDDRTKREQTNEPRDA